MHPDHLLARHREHPERVVIAQVGLAGQRVLGQVGQVLAVVRVDTCRVEGRLVVRHVGVRVPQRPAQPFQLQGSQLVNGGSFDGLEASRRRVQLRHA
jgi:hypothetical protein